MSTNTNIYGFIKAAATPAEATAIASLAGLLAGGGIGYVTAPPEAKVKEKLLQALQNGLLCGSMSGGLTALLNYAR